MNFKILFLFFSLTLIFNLNIFSKTSDTINDPREIVIKPKAINGSIFFMFKYTSDDFKGMVHKSIENRTADSRLLQKGINLQNVYYFLGQWEWMGSQHDGHLEITYYGESIEATIRNIESNQTFKVFIFPFMRKAYIPNITIGKYRFEKMTFSVCLGGSNVFNNEIYLDKELPEFTINSNTAVIYGIIDLKNAEIKLTNEEKRMQKLRKYVEFMKKFKKNSNLKVIEINADEYYSSIKKDDAKENTKVDVQTEKMKILNMLNEGKIKPEEAEKLLKALQ